MDPRATFLLSALQRGRVSFVAQYNHGFLIRRGTADPVQLANPEEGSLGLPVSLYETGRANRGATDHLDPSVWLVAPVAKLPGAPYVDRISVGRTRNCDITLRFATVSKRHGHFWIHDRVVTHLTDNASSNGTFVNGVRIPPGERVAVAFGQRLTFGTLELEYISAAEFFELIAPRGVPP